MKHTVEDHLTSCGCRSVGECFHNLTAEITALEAAVDDFAAGMKDKLRQKYLRDGWSGWDTPDWPNLEIAQCLVKHLLKGDMLDVANFALFLWNKHDGNRVNPSVFAAAIRENPCSAVAKNPST